jgi:alkyl sulfatase BDS1-like metallo-beta-lactamase superfamily hydrolase
MTDAEATEATRRANRAVAEALPFDDRADFAMTLRGLVEEVGDLVIENRDGGIAWDTRPYQGQVDQQAPDTVNPSLWRISQLTSHPGLYEVTEGIYQVRHFDISHITFVEGATGVIVIDPLVAEETAAAAIALYRKHRGDRPVAAVIFSHSHVDHYGGVLGVVSREQVASGEVPIVAPEHLLAEVISENLDAGTAMARRSREMYGVLLPKGQTGVPLLQLNVSVGTVGLIPPTDDITATGEERTIDGVRMVFQMVPHTEAPAEFNIFLPDRHALFISETANAIMHQVYTLRGAQVRDAKLWAQGLRKTIELYGDDTEVEFSTHSWPRWGRDAIREYVLNQADGYQYIHDQTLRLANRGYDAAEAADAIELPPSLAKLWYFRPYYGSVMHNSKAVWQRYLGWFDGNAANLHPLPRGQAATRYVEFFGGIDALVAKAQASFDSGDYRWVLQVLQHAVWADPAHQDARELAAKAADQLGFQSENGPWRNFYLTAAQELRQGTPTHLPVPKMVNIEQVLAMPTDLLFQFLGEQLNGPRAAEQPQSLVLTLTDRHVTYLLEVRNGVLHATTAAAEAAHKDSPEVQVSLRAFAGLLLGDATPGDVAGELTDRSGALMQLLSLLDPPQFWFGLAVPTVAAVPAPRPGAESESRGETAPRR